MILTTTIIATHRLGSTHGNPYYRVTFQDGGHADTAKNYAIGYAITNSDLHNVPVTVTFNSRGRITNVERIDGR